MISNYDLESSLKTLHKLKIPPCPALIEPLTGFWLALCSGCMLSLWCQSEYLAFVCISVPFSVTVNYVIDRYRVIRKLRYYHDNLKTMRRIIQKPTFFQIENYSQFLFISCSDRIIFDLEKMIDLSEHETINKS